MLMKALRFLSVGVLGILGLLSASATEQKIQPYKLLGLADDDPQVSTILERPDTRLQSETSFRRLLYESKGTEKKGEEQSVERRYEALNGRLEIVIRSSRVSYGGELKRDQSPQVSFVSWSLGSRDLIEDSKVMVELPFGLKLGQTGDEAMAALKDALGRFEGDHRTKSGDGLITLYEGLGGLPVWVKIADGRVHSVEFH